MRGFNFRLTSLLAAVTFALALGSECLGIRNGSPDTETNVTVGVVAARKDGNAGVFSTGIALCPAGVVLTAKHSVDKFETKNLNFILSADPQNRELPKTIFDVKEVYVAGKDLLKDVAGDLALLVLDMKCDGSGALKKAFEQLKTPLSISSEVPTKGTEAGISGFGDDGVKWPPLLRRSGTVKILKSLNAVDTDSKEKYPSFAVDPGDKGTIACRGDSGGPLFVGGAIAGIANSALAGTPSDSKPADTCKAVDFAVYTSLVAQRQALVKALQEVGCKNLK